MNVLNKLVESKQIIKAKNKRDQYYQQSYGIIPTDKQLQVIESNEEFLELTFARREGCSTATMIKAIEYAINNPRTRVFLLNYNKGIANNRADIMRDILSNSNLNKYVLRTTRNPNLIEFFNGSRINILDRDIQSFRGAAVNCLIIDIPKWLREEEIINVALSCCYRSANRQVIMLDQVG